MWYHLRRWKEGLPLKINRYVAMSPWTVSGTRCSTVEGANRQHASTWETKDWMKLFWTLTGKEKNIARGTTDPGYWIHNSNHHPWQISFWRWNDIHIWLKEPGSESKAWIIFEADHLSHLVHLPVVLLGHHHLNDNHHLPNSPTTYIVADIITLHQCPTFPATLAPPYRPP